MKKNVRIALPDFYYNENYSNALVEAGKELGIEVDPVWIGEDKSEAKMDFLPFAAFECSGYDALLIPGGVDVDPSMYDEENKGSEYMDIDMDNMQFTALIDFVSARKPILGICRGHQLTNVAFGGTLIQDIPEKERHVRHDHQDSVHGVIAEEGSFIYELYGKEFKTNSSHHQAVGNVGSGLKVTAYSDDGVVEAIEHEDLPIRTFQFHPERMCYACEREDTINGSAIIKWLVEEAAKQEDGTSII